jgi:exocyst complex component 4
MQLMGLINSLCVMLRSSPFHKENYARLILGVIIQFYQRCFDRFQNLVASKSSTRKAMPLPVIAAQWAQRTEIAPCLADLLGSVVSNLKDGYCRMLWC